MPLVQSNSKQAFDWNVRELINAGHDHKQALAIAYHIQRQHGGGAPAAPKAPKGPKAPKL